MVCSLFLIDEVTAQSLRIHSTNDSLHFEFEGVTPWTYQLKRGSSPGSKTNTKSAEIELLVPKQSSKDLAALRSVKHPRLKALSIDENGPDGRNQIKITLSNDSDEVFDYLTDQPQRLMVDFLPAEDSSPAQNVTRSTGVRKAATAEAAQKSKKTSTPEGSSPAKSAVAKDAKKSSEPKALPEVLMVSKSNANEGRKPASDQTVLQTQDKAPEISAALDGQQGVFDGADPNFERFRIKDFEIKEEAMIRRQQTVYVDFPMLKLENPILAQLIAKKPVYTVAPKDTEENKQVRLLVTLFENKRYHVFNKTVEWFFKEYPRSEYEEMIRFMWADNLFALWLEERNSEVFDLAMLRYRQVLEAFPETPLMEWALLLMGYATLDRGDVVGTLRQFNFHLQTRPKSPNRDQAMIAVAEAFMKLNQFDLAVDSYNTVATQGQSEESRRLATFLKPDVYFQKKDYRTAIQYYDEALKKYPKDHSQFPNATYNKAAAYFGLGDMKASLNEYLNFIKTFPSHNYAGFAMTRVGEILEALGAHDQKVMGAYLETYFRYGLSPSALVARLRLLSLKMETMKPKEIEKTIQDLKELMAKTDLPKIEQFTTFLIAEGFSRRGEYEKAIQELKDYYQANPTTSDGKVITSMIVSNVSGKLRKLVDDKKFLDALTWHQKHAGSWLKNTDRIDTVYDLGRSYELAGAPLAAERVYAENLNRLQALRGTRELKERAVFEKLPSETQLNLRMAQVQAQQKKWSSAYDHLRDIKDPESLAPEEQIERVQLMARLLEEKSELVAASRYLVDLVKAWKGKPSLVAAPFFQLGELELKQKKSDQALQSFEEVLSLYKDSNGKISEDLHAKSLEHIAMIHLESKAPQKAISYLDQLLSNYESTRPLETMRYKLGQIYFNQGETQKAKDVWAGLKGNRGEFWSKMAQDKIRDQEWKDSNKRYLRRIPAMAGQEAKL